MQQKIMFPEDKQTEGDKLGERIILLICAFLNSDSVFQNITISEFRDLISTYKPSLKVYLLDCAVTL